MHAHLELLCRGDGESLNLASSGAGLWCDSSWASSRARLAATCKSRFSGASLLAASMSAAAGAECPSPDCMDARSRKNWPQPQGQGQLVKDQAAASSTGNSAASPSGAGSSCLAARSSFKIRLA